MEIIQCIIEADIKLTQSQCDVILCMCTFIDHHINFEVVLCFCTEGHIIFQNPVTWISKTLVAHQFGMKIFHGHPGHFFKTHSSP